MPIAKTINEISAFKTILFAGFVAGLLDITAAIVILGKMNATGVLQFVASGAFGKAAFQGGAPMALLGLLFHFIIAFTFATIYFLVYPHISFLQKHKVLSGLLYGVIVWL